jgi:hypothetical protein
MRQTHEILVAAMLAWMVAPIPALAQPAALDKESLLLIAQETAVYFDDVHISYSLQAEKFGTLVAPNSMVELTECTLWRSGQRFRRDMVNSGTLPTGGEARIEYVESFDGARLHTRSDNARSYIIRPGPTPEEQATIGDAFMDFHLRNKVLSGTGGLRGQSVVTLLATLTAAVRPDQQNVNGHMCHVVDIHIADTEMLQGTVWIDASVGCLPMKQIFYGGAIEGGTQPVMLQFEVLKTYTVEPGVEIVQEGLKIVRPNTDNEIVYRYILEVAKGDPTLGLPIDETVFVPPVPTGYVCKDIAVNKTWIQS